MSKLFACVFPYKKSSAALEENEDDLLNQAFLTPPTKKASKCDLSYHHVDSVANKTLTMKISKLEKENAKMMKKMSYPHEVYQEKLDKEDQKSRISNYYKINKIVDWFNELPDASNIYDYID
uniref:Uncharacterized protein n=1 Tax=Caenorhabditis japonica TaxID=281687 RepID=A0A8R1DX15_CAEJA